MAETKDLVLQIVQGKAKSVADTFDDLMLDRIRNLVDDKKMEVAASILNQDDEAEEQETPEEPKEE
jgi:hypothetical protein